MIKHYLKIAIRNLIKNKGISFINIFGLTLGMTCAILIFLWVGQQLSYDQGMINKERIYRLENQTWVVMPPYLRETTLAFPEVETSARFFFWWQPNLKYENNVFTVEDLAIADSSALQIFNFDFIAGNNEEVFDAPYSIVLAESISKKLFGNKNPIGKMIKVAGTYDYRVTGIIKDIEKFHMNINAMVCIKDMMLIDGSDEFITTRSYNHNIFVLVKPNVNVKDLVAKINDRAKTVDQYDSSDLLLRPFNDIYFNNDLTHESNTKHGNMNIVIVFSMVALLILGIACINFVNLSIAKTSTREKEIAVRKVAGAKQKSIQLQFFGETFSIVVIAFILSLIAVNLALPWFSNLTAEIISFASAGSSIILILLGVLILTGILSGAYPAFYLSVLQPVFILKGKSSKGRKNSLLSRILISFQFAISVFLIIAIIIVTEQLSYVQTKDLGIDKDQVLTCKLRGSKFSGDTEARIAAKKAFTDRLQLNPNIIGATYVDQKPGELTNTWSFYNTDPENSVETRVMFVDPNFIDIMGIEMAAGSFYSFDRISEAGTGFILNEEAVRQIGLTKDNWHYINNGQVPVYGIVKDFHFNSLHNKIGPMGLRFETWPRNAMIKIAGTNIGETIKYIEQVYREFCPDVGFEYSFLDETFAKEYEADRQLQDILSYFVSIAILLSCLGLFALTALTAQQKIKEIGIRKVLGSTNAGIVTLISKSFARWVIISNLAAWPAAYFLLQNWLETFPYRIEQSLKIYIMSAVLSLMVALITIGVQAYKAAVANPVDSLRNE